MPAETKSIVPPPPLQQTQFLIRNLICAATDALMNANNQKLVITFAQLLPTVGYSILQLVDREDAG